jgi:mono/diheme cytochrome c family protein
LSRGVRILAAVLFAAIAVRIAAADSASQSSLVTQGEYLATAGNCITCHTKPSGAPFAGGVPFHTQFGTIYSTNITPDPATGIGSWTKAQFRRAMREGVSASGDHLYPAFPYTAFTKLTETDVDAIFAYLKTVPATNAIAPDNDLSFPFKQRWLMSVWKALYFDPARFTPNTKKAAEWNRGAYLVEGLGHCGACHSPRNFLGAERTEWALTGGTYLDKVPGGQIRPWSAVNLTPAPSGLKTWSVEDTAAYLQTGLNAHASTFGPMNEVIARSTRHLSDADARAIAVYLVELPPKEQPAESNADGMTLKAGQELYTIHCGTCHLPTGKGSIDTGPAVAGNPVVQGADPASLINLILYGPELPNPLPPALRVQWLHMEPYKDKLSDEDVAALASFLRSAWGNRGGVVSTDQVAAQR